jgi:TIR domain
MKTFISWSGERSNKLAKALRDWLPDVLQGIDPWMSENDIAVGSRWNQKLTEALEQTRFGILCVTPENQSTPWLIFEAGALSQSIKHSSVVPIILGMIPPDLKSPLSQFQSIEATKDGFFRLIQALNISMDVPLPEDRLTRVFERCWPELHKIVISQAQLPVDIPTPQQRKDRDILEEILDLVRNNKLTNNNNQLSSHEHVCNVHVDIRPICGEEARIVSISIDKYTCISDFLDDVYFAINRFGRVRAYSYGQLWLLKDRSSGQLFEKIGSAYVKTRGVERDVRHILSSGISCDMELIAFPITGE